MPDPRLDKNGFVILDPHQAAAAAIAACTLCDKDGYRHPAHRTVCDHQQRDTTHGRAAVRQTLAEINARRRQTTQHPHHTDPK